MNVKHILCPVDFSDSGEATLRHATSLAKDPQPQSALVQASSSSSVLLHDM